MYILNAYFETFIHQETLAFYLKKKEKIILIFVKNKLKITHIDIFLWFCYIF